MFNATVFEHYGNPKTAGALPEADVAGSEGFPGQGPYMVVYLRRVHEGTGDRIGEARFETYGCPAAIACGSWLTQWLVGKSLETAGQITAEELAIAVGGLPLGKEHCAEIAIKALRSALKKIPGK